MSRLALYSILITSVIATTTVAADFDFNSGGYTSSTTLPRTFTSDPIHATPPSTLPVDPVIGRTIVLLAASMAGPVGPTGPSETTDAQLKLAQRQAEVSKLKREKTILSKQCRNQSRKQKPGKFKSNHR